MKEVNGACLKLRVEPKSKVFKAGSDTPLDFKRKSGVRSRLLPPDEKAQPENPLVFLTASLCLRRQHQTPFHDPDSDRHISPKAGLVESMALQLQPKC